VVRGVSLFPHSLRSYVRTSAIFWSVDVLSHGCITAAPNCWPFTLTGPVKPLRTIIAGRREPPIVNSEPANGGYCPATPRPFAWGHVWELAAKIFFPRACGAAYV